MREFSLAAASLGDSLGIAFADVAGVLLQVSTFSIPCMRLGQQPSSGSVCGTLSCILLSQRLKYRTFTNHVQLICNSIVNIAVSVSDLSFQFNAGVLCAGLLVQGQQDIRC